MNEYYSILLRKLAERDQTLVTLALRALGVVGGWVLVPMLPAKLQPIARRGYIVGGVVLYFLSWLIPAMSL